MILPKKFQGIITERQNLNPYIIKVVIKITSGGDLDFTPGQFLMMEIDEKVRRAYSIASQPGNDIELFIDLRPGGPASQFFRQVKQGANCNFSAPYGLFGLKDSSLDKIFFAGSTGVAPVRSMLTALFSDNSKQLTVNKMQLTLYFGAHLVEELFLLEEFQELAKKYANFKFTPVVGAPEKEWGGRVGHVYSPFFDDQIDCQNKEFYLCGSSGMVVNCKEELLKHGVDSKLVINEKY